MPKNFHLLPIDAGSLFSDQLDNLISFWSSWFSKGKVLLFVPHFRIGNVAVYHEKKDGRFIEPSSINKETDLKCFELGLSKLDNFMKRGNVIFWFWCLYGREYFSKKKGDYVDEHNQYRHPIWNYSDLLDRYSNCTLDIAPFFQKDIGDFLADTGAHPTDDCYSYLSQIFDTNVA